MTELTTYQKMNRSRNLSFLVLVVFLILVAAKIMMVKVKTASYKDAIKLYQSSHFVAAEKQFRTAKQNMFVLDYNNDIHSKLAVLSPIREDLEQLAETVPEAIGKRNINQIVELYLRWQDSQKKWVSGTRVQQDMYREMLKRTRIDEEFKKYFSRVKEEQLAKLKNNRVIGDKGEEEIFLSMSNVPAEYYGGSAAKIKEIQDSFHQYYAVKIANLEAEGKAEADIVAEGNRILGRLEKFSMDTDWLKELLEPYVLKTKK